MVAGKVWSDKHGGDMPSREPADLEAQLESAATELKDLQTADDVRRWWSKYYYNLGHRRLGRLILGQSVDRLLERVQRVPEDS